MKGVAVRRVLSRACFGAAGVAFVAAIIPSSAGAQTVGSKPKVFSTTASAIGVDYFPDQEGGLTPIPNATHMGFVTGASSMSSSSGPTAKAFLADPGQGAIQGPANGCPVVSGFVPGAALQPIFDACVNAKWPFQAQADGFTPDARTVGQLRFGEPGAQLYGDGGGAHAVINKDDGTSSTDAQMGQLRIAPLPAGGSTGLPLPSDLTLPGQTPDSPTDTGLFASGSVQATTANTFDGAAPVTHVESRINGVKLLGGLVTIDSITSVAEARFPLDAQPVGASSTTVQGVKVLGQDATIDDSGLHAANPSADPAMQQALNASGVSVKLIGATQGFDEKGFMNAAAGGVQFEVKLPVQTGVSPPPPPPNPISPTSPNPNGTYFVRYNLATASARAFARNLTIGTSSGSTSVAAPSFSTSAPTGGAASGFTGGTVSAPAPPPPAVAGTLPATAGFLGLDPGKVKFLYLSFTLVTLGLCLVPRLALPARLPGPLKG